MSEAAFTFRVDDALKAEFSKAAKAKAKDRTGEEVEARFAARRAETRRRLDDSE